jgi:indole-3-glycerol phosphate synthase
MSLLSEILAAKCTEVKRRRVSVPLPLLEEKAREAAPPRDFRAALRRTDRAALIAEVKKASPSKGIIRESFDPVEIAQIYGANGADCLSVLTDEPYFKGHLDYLRAIRAVTDLPILRKDFIIDTYQIAESRAAGADAILLIVAALGPADLRCLLKLAGEFGLAALVEVHDAEEMREALDAGADLIGINNRDLHTFRTSISVTLDLLADLPPDPNRTVVSESGIFTHADLEKLRAAGVDAILVGEAFMREPDIAGKMHQLLEG